MVKDKTRRTKEGEGGRQSKERGGENEGRGDDRWKEG